MPRVRVRKFDRKVKFKIWSKLFQNGQTFSEIPQEDVCATFLQALHSLLTRPFTHREKVALTLLQELLQIKFSRIFRP